MRFMFFRIFKPLVFILLMQVSTAVYARETPLTVLVSIPPQKFLVQRVAGQQAKVSALMSSTDNPETYEPRPSQLRAIKDTDIFMPIGLASESRWLKILMEQNPDLDIGDCCRQLMIADDHHDHPDPHIWTDPMLSLQMAEQFKSILIGHDPGNADQYEINFRALESEILELDIYIRGLFAFLENRAFIVSHPAWGYFSRHYGLTQISLENEGKEIGPRAMTEKISQARQHGINTVFIQLQHNSLVAKRVAQEIDANVVYLDPLAGDHIRNMKETARLLAASMTR